MTAETALTTALPAAALQNTYYVLVIVIAGKLQSHLLSEGPGDRPCIALTCEECSANQC